MNARQICFFEKYPAIKIVFEKLCDIRRDEIVDELLVTDEQYKLLTQRRVNTSREVLNTLNMCGKSEQLESYVDAIGEEEVYRIIAIYKEAFLDAVEMLEQLKFL